MQHEKTALYRLFNEDDALLYIGISSDPDGRWNGHTATTPWIREVSTRTTEWHESRGCALAAEAAAIKAEHPKYDVVHRAEPITTQVRASAEQLLRDAVIEYLDAPRRALEARDAALRQAADLGLKQVDIIRITGYSRETVRQALNPEIRAAVRQAAEERKAAK